MRQKRPSSRTASGRSAGVASTTAPIGRSLNVSVMTPSASERPLNSRLSSAPDAASSKAAKLPVSAISRAARMKPAQAMRASPPPTLIRRTPSAASCPTVRLSGPPASTLTGFGATASTIAEMSSIVFAPGA